jgi:hypothetical protein
MCRGKRCWTGRGRIISSVRSGVIGSGAHSLITVKRRAESKPADCRKEGRLGQPSILTRRLGSRRSLKPDAPTLIQLRRENGREGYLAVDRLLKNILNRRSDF